MMSLEILEIINCGVSAAIQDGGRVGWRRFGVPTGGAMDAHAAHWANRLLDNSANAPVLELLLQGAELAVCNDAWIAMTGANAGASHPAWRAVRVRRGEAIRFEHPQSGVWSYLAVEGGFDASRMLGSASVYARGGLGQLLKCGDVLRRATGHDFHLPDHIAGRMAPWSEQRNYAAPPPLRVWRGPQWDSFNEAERKHFFDRPWTVSPRSDRVGYRLTGEPLKPRREQIISEPVRVGTIQIPESGEPIVTLRDGPTVGGYPKLGMIDPVDLSWLVQCCPRTSSAFSTCGMNFDLNCDLGEGEPRTRTEALMRAVTSANVACGGHAGTEASMSLCVRLAKRYSVRLGAHPGPPETKDFGRGKTEVTPDQFELWLLTQVQALQNIARQQRVRLHHIKLHGALYHASETDPKVARCYVQVVAERWPGVKIFALADGRVASFARRAGVLVWEEAFLDRRYRDDGTLVLRAEPGALLTSAKEVLARMKRLRAKGEIVSVSGKVLRLHPQTLCIHSDTPRAVHLARAVANFERHRLPRRSKHL